MNNTSSTIFIIPLGSKSELIENTIFLLIYKFLNL